MRRLVHIGSVLVDIGVRVPRPPARGEDMLASSASMAVAGGFNILSAAYRQGMPAAYGGNIGSGRFGAMAVETLAAEGIEVLLPPKHEGDTGFCVVMVDATGERTMVTTMGVEAYMTPEDLAAIELRDDDFVYLSGYDLAYPHGPAVADWLRDHVVGQDLVFDPCPLLADIPAELLSSALDRATWISLNEREATLLTGDSDPRTVLARGSRLRGAVVRRGAEGCLLVTEAGIEHIPAFPAEVIDTTGAGDAHVGAFAAALARGVSPARACRFGNATASVVVSTWGPATAPGLEVTERLVGT